MGLATPDTRLLTADSRPVHKAKPNAICRTADLAAWPEATRLRITPQHLSPDNLIGLQLAQSAARPRERAAPNPSAHSLQLSRGDMGTLRATGFCALLTAVLATSAFAQKAQTRQGLWVGGGMGYGTLGLSCEGCGDTEREGGVSGFAKIGGTLRQNILLGVEMNGWTKSEGTGRVTMGNMSGAAYWY